MKKKHANSNENEAEHHLYEIYDQERDDIYKYGICGDPLKPDGSSPRANVQVKDYNRIWLDSVHCEYFANGYCWQASSPAY